MVCRRDPFQSARRGFANRGVQQGVAGDDRLQGFRGRPAVQLAGEPADAQ